MFKCFTVHCKKIFFKSILKLDPEFHLSLLDMIYVPANSLAKYWIFLLTCFLFECDVGRIGPIRGQYYEAPPTQKITKYLIKTKRLLFPIIYYFFGEWRTKTLRLSYWLWNLVVRDPRKLNHIQNKNTSLFYIFTLINLLRKIQFWSDTLTC